MSPRHKSISQPEQSLRATIERTTGELRIVVFMLHEAVVQIPDTKRFDVLRAWFQQCEHRLAMIADVLTDEIASPDPERMAACRKLAGRWLSPFVAGSLALGASGIATGTLEAIGEDGWIAIKAAAERAYESLDDLVTPSAVAPPNEPKSDEDRPDSVLRDSLTGLPNRDFFQSHIADNVSSARRHGLQYETAILLIDLDGFIAVNNSLGHAGGDEVLRTVAARLMAKAGTGDVVARLGSDEFGLFRSWVHDQKMAERLAREVAEAISLPFLVNGQVVNLRVRIGVAVNSRGAWSADEYLENADVALHQAKQTDSQTGSVFEVVHS